MASADFSGPVPPGFPCGSPMFWTEPEISRGKTCLLLPDPSDLPAWCLNDKSGVPVPGRVTHTTLALYPFPLRRVRDFAISFLQIPPRDGHPCLDGWFRSLRSIGDSHPLNAHHYSTHQAEACATAQAATTVKSRARPDRWHRLQPVLRWREWRRGTHECVGHIHAHRSRRRASRNDSTRPSALTKRSSGKRRYASIPA